MTCLHLAILTTLGEAINSPKKKCVKILMDRKISRFTNFTCSLTDSNRYGNSVLMELMLDSSD